MTPVEAYGAPVVCACYASRMAAVTLRNTARASSRCSVVWVALAHADDQDTHQVSTHVHNVRVSEEALKCPRRVGLPVALTRP